MKSLNNADNQTNQRDRADQTGQHTQTLDNRQASQQLAKCHMMMVCTGNICRSAMAEVIVRAMVEERGLADRITVASSGVSSEEQGNPIDYRAARVLREHGYQVPRNHVAHNIMPEEVAETDFFFAMTSHHFTRLESIVPSSSSERIHMYREFDPQAPKVDSKKRLRDLDLEDPWYGGMREFEIAIDQIERTAPHLIDWVVEQYGW